MISSRILTAAVLSVVAIAAHAGVADASDEAQRPPAALSTDQPATGATSTAVVPAGAGACNTGFGTAPDPRDGIISWNDGSSYDTSGAADFVCTGPTTIDAVLVPGYFGAANTELFNVRLMDTTFVSPPGCEYLNLTGNGSGNEYPLPRVVVFTLSEPCHLPAAGQYWLSVQNANPAGPWYWEAQVEQSGQAPPDFRDANDVFGSGCTTWDNDRYLLECLGYAYGDFMFALATCTITGAAGNDTLYGTAGDDVICGKAGADTLDGFGGNDIVLAGSGDDTLRGGSGRDMLFGESGDDNSRGQGGIDWLIDLSGTDVLRGDNGADTLDARDTFAADTLICGAGADTWISDGSDTLSGDC